MHAIGQAVRGESAAALAIVVMGVSGTGKTTLATALAHALACPMLEGDTYHSAANVAKMRDGHPLTDEDRWPWLDRLGAALGDAARERGRAVAACSALRRAYRERLGDASGLRPAFVLLALDHDTIARRMATRSGHYMPVALLDSQLATLEPPTADERALTLDSTRPPDELVAAVRAWLGLG
ncbi:MULTISPECIES: gluconokinase [unclassified Sphingomonas]|uniref:gluconokinase n=1 Tax=unclassified Sphingomonas TaxID=196159 RepID=UPI00182A6135|nr:MULTISPECIES: gluconokinase [unclassified Sphingomonas]MBB3348423.1 gluconokinase [Sphingomonas sp. BK069]MBB3475021.1 gluconokinase [Sphingomonas sp. BK345]